MNWRWILLVHVPEEVRLTRDERAALTDRIRKMRVPFSLWNELAGFFITLVFIALWLTVWW